MMRNFDILSDRCNIECRKSGALYCLWNGDVNLQSAMILLSIFFFFSFFISILLVVETIAG